MRVNTQDSAWRITCARNSLVSSPVSQGRKSEPWENRDSDRSRGRSLQVRPAYDLSWNFHVWLAGTKQLLSRSWLRECECLRQGATTAGVKHSWATEPPSLLLPSWVAQARAVKTGGSPRGQPASLAEGQVTDGGVSAWACGKQHPGRGASSSACPRAPQPLQGAPQKRVRKLSWDFGTRLRKYRRKQG